MLPTTLCGVSSPACQEERSHTRMRGAGMPPGEPTEQNNAELKGCAANTKYCTRTRRQARWLFLEESPHLSQGRQCRSLF